MTILPKRLKKWDTIWLIAPSKPYIEKHVPLVQNFIEHMESLWLNVIHWKNFHKTDKYWTAWWTPQERAEDINIMFADSNIQAIRCLQWWSLANQTLEHIDFDIIRSNPKLILGKSDIDILLVAINSQTWIPTIHTCDSKIWQWNEMDYEYTKQRFVKRCFEWSKEIVANDEWKVIRGWKVQWRLLWCNIQSLLKISWTKYAPNYTNTIFFFETYEGDPSSLIHRLTTMKLQWCFDSIKWIVIWSNYWWKSEEFSSSDIINDFFDQDIPIMKTNMFGHYQPHAFLPIGSDVSIDTSNRSITILSDFVS